MGTQIPEERWKDKLNLDVQVSVTEMSYAEDPKAPADFQEPEIIPTLGTVRNYSNCLALYARLLTGDCM
jgi:hypothetical protein